jgi:3-deoxy-7-phosphoheptulonate synthase
MTLPSSATADTTAADLLASITAEPDSAAFEAVPLPTPRALKGEYPATLLGRHVVRQGQETIRQILHRRDNRLLAVVGPCSIHDPEAAIDYAAKLAQLSERLSDRIYVVMRTYFEKPRTTVGWRGLINDPHLDGTFDMAEGLRQARRLLAEITAMGLPVATEMLDTTTPAYFADLISLAAIGARTVESQPHRALASGLGMPVGFKNGTDGGLQTALDAIVSARQPHSYLGVDAEGRSCALKTAGNRDSFLILRGGKATGPNHVPASVAEAEQRLRTLGTDTPPSLLVDCSHANSGYDPEKQKDVCASVVAQRRASGDNAALIGVMLESNLYGGKQTLNADNVQGLRYGVSVTDGCLGWDDTERLLLDTYDALR